MLGDSVGIKPRLPLEINFGFFLIFMGPCIVNQIE